MWKAKKYPIKVENNDPITFKKVIIIASTHFFSWIIKNISDEKAEKVVKLPKNPTTTKTLQNSEIFGYMETMYKKIPIKKHPERLATRVPIEKFGISWLRKLLIIQRKQAPIAAPKEIAIIVFNNFNPYIILTAVFAVILNYLELWTLCFFFNLNKLVVIKLFFGEKSWLSSKEN